jgi:predicted DNA-binding antitoxin AbrB/MazE fold protein
MTTVEAIYEDGVFKPIAPVALPDKQRVRLSVRPLPAADVQTWLDEAKRLRDELQAKYGIFEDSTPLIAEDRMRDV